MTCPTESTFKTIIESKIFDEEKIYLLKDPIISIKNINKYKNEKLNTDITKNKYILGIGRLTTQKNFKLLLNFYIKLIKKYPEYKLYILGEGEDRIMLNNLIEKYQLNAKAFLLGHQDNIFKYLKHADCFILSSLWEDPGFVLVEAAAMNTNIISSNCPNGPEEIISNNDFLFTNGSSDDLLTKFQIYKNKNAIDLVNQKIRNKKKIKFYTLFQHYKGLNSILN